MLKDCCLKETGVNNVVVRYSNYSMARYLLKSYRHSGKPVTVNKNKSKKERR
jgi:hypothetical protein